VIAENANKPNGCIWVRPNDSVADNLEPPTDGTGRFFHFVENAVLKPKLRIQDLCGLFQLNRRISEVHAADIGASLRSRIAAETKEKNYR